MSDSDTINISTQQKSFKFINEVDSDDKSYYIIKITVDTLLYGDGILYYNISYDYDFNGDEKSKNQIHPFYNSENNKDFDHNRVIVYKNKMTDIMVEYLLESSEKLKKVSGTSTEQNYRTTIMLNLARLWD